MTQPATRPVLVTAFGPFADVERNPSADLLDRLLAADHRFVGEILPVEYEAGGRRIEQLIDSHQPQAILLLGVARRAAVARLERLARNWDDATTPDNAGVLRCGTPIFDGAPEFLSATLNLDSMSRLIRQAGLDVEISDDAGGFLCNHVYYRARAAADDLGLRCPCVFLHLPDQPLDDRWFVAVRSLAP